MQTGSSSGQPEPLEEVDSPGGIEAANSETELKDVNRLADGEDG